MSIYIYTLTFLVLSFLFAAFPRTSCCFAVTIPCCVIVLTLSDFLDVFASLFMFRVLQMSCVDLHFEHCRSDVSIPPLSLTGTSVRVSVSDLPLNYLSPSG